MFYKIYLCFACPFRNYVHNRVWFIFYCKLRGCCLYSVSCFGLLFGFSKCFGFICTCCFFSSRLPLCLANGSVFVRSQGSLCWRNVGFSFGSSYGFTVGPKCFIHCRMVLLIVNRFCLFLFMSPRPCQYFTFFINPLST